MNRRNWIKTIGSAALLPMAMQEAQGEVGGDINDDTVYEWRVYHLDEGKLPLILERFRSRETKIFARLGMTGIAYWVPTEEPMAGRTLIYLLRHKSREAARDSWAKFKVDPEWVALKAESEKDGKFVIKSESTFMKLTDFSPKL